MRYGNVALLLLFPLEHLWCAWDFLSEGSLDAMSIMMPILPFKYRVVPPLLFLVLVGGMIAVADYWMRRQPQPPAVRRSPATQSRVRRAAVARRRRARG